MSHHTKKVRFYEIDLLRFLAAIAVVLYHYTFVGNLDSPELQTVTYPVLAEYTRYSYLGVNLFFLISGFVILLSANNRSAVEFASSRFIRLYPAFWASVTLTAVGLYFFGGSFFSVTIPQYLMNMTMVSGFLDVKQIDGVYWTLLVELIFYTLIFLLLLFKLIRYIELFLGIWLGIVLLSLIVSPLPLLVRFLFIPEWAPYFISGSLFYLIHSKGLDLTRGLLLLSAYLLSIYYSVIEVGLLKEGLNVYYNSLVPVAWVTVFYIIFILIISHKMNWLRSASLIKVGLLTYPLYLIHANLGYLVFNHFAGSINKYLLLLLIILFMLTFSWLIHYIIEKPLAKFLKRMINMFLSIAIFKSKVKNPKHVKNDHVQKSSTG